MMRLNYVFGGAESIMASHWSVESNITKRLVTNFFENLKNQLKWNVLRQWDYLWKTIF